MESLQESSHVESWSTGHFDATLLANSLKVGFIPAENLVHCTHALVKILVQDAEESESTSLYGDAGAVVGAPSSPPGSGDMLDIGGLGASNPEPSGVNVMLVQDMGGVTVIVNERYHELLRQCGVLDFMRWAPAPWRALQIHLGPDSADAPGIISYLSSMLSERNVSILNFSTFEADLILVQDHDLTKARELLVECGHDGVTGLKEQMAEKSHGVHSFADADGGTSAAAAAAAAANSRTKARSNSTSSETISSASLNVVQTPLVLATIKRVMLKQSMFALMKQLTRNIDAQLARSQQQSVVPDAEGLGSAATLLPQYLQASNLEQDYLWAYFSTFEEVSLLIDERDLVEFPEDALVVCRERYKAIRLVGKDIPFDETGIVKIMSSPFDLGVQLLNMSTYGTNISLVVEDSVERAVERLLMELNGKDTKVFGHYRRASSLGVNAGGFHSRQPLHMSLQQLQLQHSQQRQQQPLHGLRSAGAGNAGGLNTSPSQNHSGVPFATGASHGSRFVHGSDFGAGARTSGLNQHSQSRPMPVMMEHR